MVAGQSCKLRSNMSRTKAKDAEDECAEPSGRRRGLSRPTTRVCLGRRTMGTLRKACMTAVLVVGVSVALVQPAQAAVTINRAELSGTQVSIEGSGATPNAGLTVNGGPLNGTADGSGRFRIESA